MTSAKLTGKGLVAFAEKKVGTPYVFGAKLLDGNFTQKRLDVLAEAYKSMFTERYYAKARKFVGKPATDCSGLISGYTRKNIGSAQMYSSATQRGSLKELKEAPVGAVLYKQGHVGIYTGSKCIEAKGINFGTVITDVKTTSWTHWLLFEDLLDYGGAVLNKPVVKGKNPYKQPERLVIQGMSGEDVKWLQFELLEAGITYVTVKGINRLLTVDGDFGPITSEATRAFQQSAKLVVDRICGPKTIKALILN